MAEVCGAPTKSGGKCSFEAARCPHPWHRRMREAEPRRQEQPAGMGDLPAAVVARDLRETGWWVIERLTTAAEFESKEGAVVATVLRVLAGLGPSPLAEEEALAEVELRGRLAHGLPPASAAEWERVMQAFEPGAVDEFRRWEAEDERLALLLEGDGDDRGEPEVGFRLAGDGVEVARGVGDEERVISEVLEEAAHEAGAFAIGTDALDGDHAPWRG